MRWLKRILIFLAGVLVIASLIIKITGHDQIFYGIGKTWLIGKSKPDIDDQHYFSTRVIQADQPEPWPLAKDYGLKTFLPGDKSYVDSLRSRAFLVIRTDSILFEYYSPETDQDDYFNSFSMAKSVTGLLIGIAEEEGYLSLEDPIGKYIPEYTQGLDAQITIRHLLQMTSGIPFGESYNSPLGYMAKAYYGKDLISETLKYHATTAPGQKWVYEGGNSVLLGMIIHRATGRTPSDYCFEKLWSCIGAEHAAYWNLDHENGVEKTFSGLYATPRDFARIGRLIDHRGIQGPDTIVSPAFIDKALSPCLIPDESGEQCTWYGFHWWLGEHQGHRFYSCRGMRGQYIIVLPEQHLVVVRMGHEQLAERINHMPPDLLRYIEIALSIAS